MPGATAWAQGNEPGLSRFPQKRQSFLRGLGSPPPQGMPCTRLATRPLCPHMPVDNQLRTERPRGPPRSCVLGSNAQRASCDFPDRRPGPGGGQGGVGGVASSARPFRTPLSMVTTERTTASSTGQVPWGNGSLGMTRGKSFLNLDPQGRQHAPFFSFPSFKNSPGGKALGLKDSGFAHGLRS